MSKPLFILSFFLCFAGTFAQQKLRRADKLFAEFAYTEAAQLYEEYLTGVKDPKPEVITHAADAYYFTAKMGGALRWYEKLYELQGAAMDDTHFRRYILALRGEERYERADELLFQRLDAIGDETLKKSFVNQKQHLDSLVKNADLYTVKNLDINTNKADFGTAFYGNKMVYASAKDTVKGGGKTYSWNQQPYLSLYVADRDTASGAFLNEKKFLAKTQTDYHNAAPAFSPDLKTVYYSANTVNKKDKLQNSVEGTNNIQLIKGEIKGDALVNVATLSFNSKDYSVGQPAVSADGHWLFFVSDMPGGYGETDIYIAQIFSDGVVGEPKNIGPEINTPGREMFPFINNDVLYFSSDGHYGLGGLDVFISKRTGEVQFEAPQNIGSPVNSNLDDFAFVTDNSGAFGYLSSNRAGGKGDDDIYYVAQVKKPCTHSIAGTVVNLKAKTPIEGADVKAYDEQGTLTASVKTDANGNYTLDIPCGKVVIEASKPEHTIVKIQPELLRIDFELSAYADLVKKEDNVERIDINPIYFDFDQYYITPQAAVELDKVVYVMQNFPDVVIKIESHTDSRGNDDYNMRLSDDRAKSTYSYIVSKGILPTRIESVKGYGESQLRNHCSNGVECTPEEHQLNRRSDFIVVKK
ncbi:OmpA family protein [Flavobacterium sp. Sd200]|uniref:OmpA family protein n=1 Tax=Flavobacterium sp. Sd200 TaxID=2692211 RepID=UPI001367B29B|nr:OmpA family protein [Flavobacterium sp. Sd200]MXN89835.1 OmpA family protein [Flavobacterium sp. Sd200]